MHRPAFAFALLAFAAPLVAKPGAPQTRYRTDGIALCARQLGTVEGADADEVEALCSCAADRFVAARDAAVLPALDPSGMPSGMGAEVLRCLGDVRPAAAGALAAEAMRPLGATAPPPADTSAAQDKPVSGDGAATPSGPGLLSRLGAVFDRMSFSGLPRWAWGLIALLGLLVLRRLFRRPVRADDLMGPPRPDRYRNLPRY